MGYMDPNSKPTTPFGVHPPRFESASRLHLLHPSLPPDSVGAPRPSVYGGGSKSRLCLSGHATLGRELLFGIAHDAAEPRRVRGEGGQAKGQGQVRHRRLWRQTVWEHCLSGVQGWKVLASTLVGSSTVYLELWRQPSRRWSKANGGFDFQDCQSIHLFVFAVETG